MRLHEHMYDCLAKLGSPYTEIHRWLDNFFGDPRYKSRHRRVRHHLAGIEDARKLFGDKGAEAARLHIIADLKMEGWNPDKDAIPLNEEDYVKRGFW